jgi:glycerophosphoryl diester phosphodiesterase
MRPQVVAHRGASHELAEHTLGAYLRALDAGAGALECDIRLTADGHLVCVHDRDLRRTSGSRGLVSTMDLAELNELDFATWKNPWADLDDEAPDRDEVLDGVLTLRKLLETVADYERRVEVAIETKHPTRFGGLVEKRLVEMLRSFGWEEPGSPVRVMSFSFTALQRVERLAPDVQRVQLVDKAGLWPMLRQVVGPDTTMGPGIELLREHPRVVESMGRRDRPLHVWVVNTEADLDLCVQMGVRAVITDRPSHLLELLDGRGETPG